MKLIKTTLATTLISLLLSSNAVADCSYELFSISSTKNTRIIDFVEQLSDECDFSIIVTDPNAETFLNSRLNKTNLNNLTIDEVFNIILKENNLSYTLENNILKISYLTTRMFNIDYILSSRKSTGKTNITLSSEGAGMASQGGIVQQTTTTEDGLEQGGGSAGKAGVSIETEDEVQFWNELDLEFQKVLNRPQDVYKADAPIINKNAGIITVTATHKQLDRLDRYLKKLQTKVKLQALIDVQILSVTMSKGKTTGIDWKQLWALQDMSIIYGASATRDNGRVQNNSYVTMTGKGTLNEVIKFLETQGDVSAVSNPKVLTLNNQPALITAGTEYFYKILSTQTLAGGNTGTQAQNEDIQSVFAGVLLDITPEIADDDIITLKINPSISEAVDDSFANIAVVDRTMPPDLQRRQLSSVVTVKDGTRIILGGLINTRKSKQINKVPILGDIPIINYLFKWEENIKITQELVIILEPHIIKNAKNDVSLKDLGYEEYEDNSAMSNDKSLDEIVDRALVRDKKEDDDN
jgi:general secretion pathway protein D